MRGAGRLDAAAPDDVRPRPSYAGPSLTSSRNAAIVRSNVCAASARYGREVLAVCAVVLAERGHALRDEGDQHLPPVAAVALAAYEVVRRRRVERIVAAGARTSGAKAAGLIGRVLRDATLPLVLPFAGRSQGWIHGHPIDGDAPVRAAGIAVA